MTRTLLIGSEGIIGRKLSAFLPAPLIRMDITGEPDVRSDILDYPELPECDVIIMLACSVKDPNASFEALQPSLHMAEFVVLTAISRGIPVVFASSVWAENHPLNAYGCMKRCIEQMVDSHGGDSVRVGWVGYTQADWEAAPELRGWAWSDLDLYAAFGRAIVSVIAKDKAKEASAELRQAALAKIAEWRSLR